MEEKCYTPQEYLQMKEQEELDRIFDEAIMEAHNKQLEEMKSKEHEKLVTNLITKVADSESELNILEQIFKELCENPDSTKQEKEQIQQDIKMTKMKLTKTQNELENLLIQEKIK